MANATTKLLLAGLLVVLPVSAGDPKRGQAAQHAVPDVMVYVESELVGPSMLLPAEATATRMFAGIGVRVQWENGRRRRRAEPASGGCAPKRSEEIVVRMASGRAASASREAFAYALPYASDGVRDVALRYVSHELGPESVTVRLKDIDRSLSLARRFDGTCHAGNGPGGGF